MNDIPAPVQLVLDLFAMSLGDVRFADVDAGTLTRVAADVDTAAEVVAVAQAALDAARATLQEKQDALLQQAHRALAYARVYAESDEALSAQLEAIALPRLARRTKSEGEALVLSAEPPPSGPRRGRPRKVAGDGPSASGLHAHALRSASPEPMLDHVSMAAADS